MSDLNIKPKIGNKYDCLSAGEVMLRLDPGDNRIRSTRQFTVWEGGGEYNVVRGLKKCFKLDTSIVTALADNDIGRLVEDLIMQGGVDTSLIKWCEFDGIGRETRNGLNFVERGFGIRGALGVSDRGNTAVSKLKPGDIDWHYIFGELGVRWFHSGGIFGGLSETTSEVLLEGVKTAKKYGTIVSYDINYRPSLWNKAGGYKGAEVLNKKIAPYVDVMFGMLGEEVEIKRASHPLEINNTQDYIDTASMNYIKLMGDTQRAYPNIKIIANTIRNVKSANRNDWAGILYSDDKMYRSSVYEDLEIFDRIGGGDSFAAGIIYGLLMDKDLVTTVNYGAAHGALAMTTPGDTSMASLKEIIALVEGKDSSVIR